MELRRREAPFFLVGGASVGYGVPLPAVAANPARQSMTAIAIPSIIAFTAVAIGAAIIAGASFGLSTHRDCLSRNPADFICCQTVYRPLALGSTVASCNA
jgi:hypothetical protein